MHDIVLIWECVTLNVTNDIIFGGIDEVKGISCDCRHDNKNGIIYSLDPYLDKQQSFENILIAKIQKFSCLWNLENLSSLFSKKRWVRMNTYNGLNQHCIAITIIIIIVIGIAIFYYRAFMDKPCKMYSLMEQHCKYI